MDSNFIIWTQILTSIVALLAFLLSLFNFVFSLLDRKSKIKTNISLGVISYGNKNLSCLIIEVINIRNITTLISNVSVSIPNKRKISFISDYVKYPIELKSRTNFSDYLPLEKFNEAIRNENLSGKILIRAIVRDGTDKIYKSKKLKYEL